MNKRLLFSSAILLFSSLSMAKDLDKIDKETLLQNPSATIIDASLITTVSKQLKEEYQQKLMDAKDGDVITFSDGKFHNLGQIEITANNVTITSENPGKTWLTGLVQIKAKGDNITIDGLVFTEGGPKERFGGVRLEGHKNTLKNTSFIDFNHDYPYEPDARRAEYPKYLWLSLWGKEAQVINNRFEGKYKRGTTLGVQKDDTPDKHLIKNNLFLDQRPNLYNEFDNQDAIRYNANTWEAIRIGDSKSSQWSSQTSLIDNLFIDMDGEHELISIKSGDNLIQGNMIVNSASLISLRHGKNNIVENNIILGNGKEKTGGIRIYDAGHKIVNNYIAETRGYAGDIEGNADIRGAIVLNTGIIDVKNGEVLDQSIKGKELNKQWTPHNIDIKNNSIINCQWGIVHGNQTHRVSLYNNDKVRSIFGAVDVRFSNNLVSTDENFTAARASADFPIQDATYENEHYYGKLVPKDAFPNNIITQKPTLKNQGPFLYSDDAIGADVKKLKILTLEIVGPNYIIQSTGEK